MHKYNVVMFAHNEQKSITDSVNSVLSNTDEQLNRFYVIANGCTDNTVPILQAMAKKPENQRLTVIELSLGDKCNAWNHYMHSLADEVDVHFLVDADVQFTHNAFPIMAKTLVENEEATAVAGLPFSGRNRDYYLSLVFDRSCLFGNCYGVKHRFVELVRSKPFRLPIGLGWIDSAITKAINTDIEDQFKGKPGRVTYNLEAGYTFSSLNFLKPADIKLYLSRIARYQQGKLQEKYLEKIDFWNWPENMYEINLRVQQTLKKKPDDLSWIMYYLVKKRVNRQLEKQRAKANARSH